MCRNCATAVATKRSQHKKCRNCATALATPDRAHRRFSPNFPFPARPNKKNANLELRRRLWRPGARGKEMWRPRGSETINVLSLRNGCGDSGVRTKKRHVGSAPGVELDKCVEIARWMWRRKLRRRLWRPRGAKKTTCAEIVL